MSALKEQFTSVRSFVLFSKSTVAHWVRSNPLMILILSFTAIHSVHAVKVWYEFILFYW